MPTRFVEVWLEGNSYLPLPRAFLNEPFRLYHNRLRGFFAKHAPSYPAIPLDLVRRAYADSQFFARMSSRLKPWGGHGVAWYRMSKEQKLREIARRQRIGRTQGFAAFAPRPAGLNRRAVASKETGFVDLANANYNCDTTGSIALVATIAQGASVNQRVGKKVLLKSCQVRGVVYAGSTGTHAQAAWMLVYDRRPTGSLPAITDILVTANATAFTNDANSGRFRIVRRWSQSVTGNTGTPVLTEELNWNIDEFINLRNLPEVFKAAGTGAIGDIEEGALYLVTVGSVAAGTAAPVAALGFRTRFVDV